MSTSPPLPVTNQPQPPQITTTPALRAFLSRLSSSIRQSLSQRRPWSELLDRSAFARPENLSDATSRVRKNLSYFKVNYATLISLVLALSLITHPLSLVVLLALLSAWIFLYLFKPSDQPVVIFGRTFSDREVLGLLVLTTVIVVFLTSVGSLLISALMIGVAIVCTHGAFRIPEDLFLDEPQEPASAGLLSFLGGAASSAAAAAPSVATRV